MAHIPDSVLVKRLSESDEKAFTALYYRYTDKIRNFLVKLRLDFHTDDIIQETFITVWRKRKEIDASLNFSAYLFTISRNLALKSLKQELYTSISESDISFDTEDEESFRIRETFYRALEASIEKLPERPRQVLILKRIKGRSTEEIALELGISKSTVENHMNRALAVLKEELSGFSAVGVLLLEICFS